MLPWRTTEPAWDADRYSGQLPESRRNDDAMHCGATMLTTVHGSGMDEIREKPLVSNLVKERCFARYVVMKSGKHVGEIEGIYNERGEKLCI